jgi:regulatory protein
VDAVSEMQEINPNDLRLVAMNLLARRDHSRQELREKLCRRFGAGMQAEIEQLLDQLCVERLLCDRRYAESYIHSRSSKGQGPLRIRQELRQKGLCSELLSEVMAELQVDWVALAREVRRKKFGPVAPADFAERARQLRFLGYRGFDGEVASAALDDAVGEEIC